VQNGAIYQYLFDSLETPFLSSVAQLVNLLLAYAARPVELSVIIYVALTGILVMGGMGGMSASAFLRLVTKIALVLWFATVAGVYAGWVQDFFMAVLSNDIGRAISGTAGDTLNANSFDRVWTQAYDAGLRVWAMLSRWDIGEEICVLVFWSLALAAISIGFAVWFISHFILGLYVVIGPLLIPLVLFGATKAIFERWIGSMISCIILQVFAVILLALLLRVEGQLLQQILIYRGPNVFEQIRILFAGVAFFLLAGFTAFMLPGLASSLAGGLHFHVGAIARGLASGAGYLGQGMATAGRAANAGVDRGVAGIRQRIRPTTGGSLSRTSSTP